MHQASGAGKRKSPKRFSLLTFVLIGDTGTRRVVLRLACARLHPPPRPPRKPDARCPPRLLTTRRAKYPRRPRRGASDSEPRGGALLRDRVSMSPIKESDGT